MTDYIPQSGVEVLNRLLVEVQNMVEGKDRGQATKDMHNVLMSVSNEVLSNTYELALQTAQTIAAIGAYREKEGLL